MDAQSPRWIKRFSNADELCDRQMRNASKKTTGPGFPVLQAARQGERRRRLNSLHPVARANHVAKSAVGGRKRLATQGVTQKNRRDDSIVFGFDVRKNCCPVEQEFLDRTHSDIRQQPISKPLTILLARRVSSTESEIKRLTEPMHNGHSEFRGEAGFGINPTNFTSGRMRVFKENRGSRNCMKPESRSEAGLERVNSFSCAVAVTKTNKQMQLAK